MIQVKIAGFDATHVKMVERPGLTARQQRLKETWLAAR
jgi:hypothetical protein